MPRSNIPGTVIHASFSFALTRWLVHCFPGDIQIESAGAGPETIRVFFRVLLPRTEFESISAGELSLAKRIRLLKGASPLSGLAWLLQLLDSTVPDERMKEYLFQSLQLYTYWKVSHPLPTPERFQNKGFLFPPARKKNIRLAAISRQPLPAPVQLDAAEKKECIAIARYSLALLCRETEPFTYADPDALTCFQLENGLTVILYGMETGRRLSIESYIGYLALINGTPVAYGGGWIFGHRCQFGINILPAFRGTASAEIFAGVIRVYRQYFGITQLFIKPYQFGKNNPEAIRSGAFWFYYKMGFRPDAPGIKRRAGQERKKIKAHSHYRCSPAVLKKLAGANLFLAFDPPNKPLPDASLASKAITAWIQSGFAGNREKALQFSRRVINNQFSFPSPGPLKKALRDVQQEWGLLSMALLRPEDWSLKDKKMFVQLILAKARGDERRFIRLLQQHQPFWKDFATVQANPSYI